MPRPITLEVRLIACLLLLSSNGCAPMFNAGVKDLAVESAANRPLDRAASRKLDGFKIDPLRFEDISTSMGPAYSPTESGKIATDAGKRQAVTEMASIPPKPINKLIRLEPIIDDGKKPATNVVSRPDNKSESVPADGALKLAFEQPPESVPVALVPEAASGGDFVSNATSSSSTTAAMPVATMAADGNHNDFATAGIRLPENGIESKPPASEPASFISRQMEQLVPPFANHPDDVLFVDSCEFALSPETPTANEHSFEQFIANHMNSNADGSVSTLLELLSEPIATVTASHDAFLEPCLTWQNQLRKTIEVFADEIDLAGESSATEKLKTGLSILQALETDFGNHGMQADNSESELKEYWSHQILAINELLKHSAADNGGSPPASLALEHLHLAVNELAAIADLQLGFTAFCTKVTGYGQFTPFAKSEFDSDQSVLVYCEIENFAPLLETKNGMTNYQTQLSSSFWITNASDSIVQQQDYPAVTDNARNLRRDFFMHLPVTFAELPSGEYALHIKVRDHGSGKIATLEQAMKFSIR